MFFHIINNATTGNAQTTLDAQPGGFAIPIALRNAFTGPKSALNTAENTKADAVVIAMYGIKYAALKAPLAKILPFNKYARTSAISNSTGTTITANFMLFQNPVIK